MDEPSLHQQSLYTIIIIIADLRSILSPGQRISAIDHQPLDGISDADVHDNEPIHSEQQTHPEIGCILVCETERNCIVFGSRQNTRTPAQYDYGRHRSDTAAYLSASNEL